AEPFGGWGQCGEYWRPGREPAAALFGQPGVVAEGTAGRWWCRDELPGAEMQQVLLGREARCLVRHDSSGEQVPALDRSHRDGHERRDVVRQQVQRSYADLPGNRPGVEDLPTDQHDVRHGGRGRTPPVVYVGSIGDDLARPVRVTCVRGRRPAPL